MKTSVVIPCYNKYYLLHQLLYDLYKTCADDIDEIVVVNDASTEKDFENGLRDFWFKENHLPVRLLSLKNNVGFLKAANRGMKYAEGDVLCLISNDVRIHTNIIKRIKESLVMSQKQLIGNRLINFDSGWNTFNGKTYSYIEGWLLACTRDAWNDVGGFDERFAPADFEDVDLSTAFEAKGYSLCGMNNSKVEHLGAQSYGYNPEREAITKRNQKLFEEKWVK
ncbi:MAG: glycosyltransferase family 2 protein [Candidatus Hodarchaeales archaeon]|jgi:GT2 family glycosyltransferase